MVKRDNPELRKLFNAVRRLTGKRGKNPELAAHLGVHESQLYDWTSGRFEPGGEATLRIHKWVVNQERQRNKDAGAVAAAPARKARTKKSDETKISPSRRRK